MSDFLLETYGLTLESGGAPLTQLDYELACFRLNLDLLDEGKPDDIGLGADQHFINVAKTLWGMNTPKPFVWTDQARMMLHRMCREKVLTITGHARSTKTALSSIWNLVLWLSEPDNTKGIVVSTEKGGASNRIWGQITDWYNAIPNAPGRIYAQGWIVPFDPTGRLKFSRRNGLELLAGNENKERESATKLQGYHTGGIIPGRICLTIDEGTAVAAGIFDAYFKNLSANPKARFIALGNFNRKEGPFGRLCEPTGGWETVEPEDQFWRTKRGACIHLDGLQSPNWVAQKDVHPFLQSYTQVKGFYDQNLENTPEFWEMVRAFPAPVGVGDLGVYDPAEITMYKGDQRVADLAWKHPPTLWAGFDPAFKAHGDAATIVPIRTGIVQDGWFLIEALEPIRIPIDAQGGKPATYQMLDYLYEWQQRAGCDIQNIGYDNTDSGFSDALTGDTRFGKHVYSVTFGGAPSDLVLMKPGDNRVHKKNNERYANRVTELWCMGLDFLRQGQLRGLVGAIHSEMTKRAYVESTHRGGNILQKIEMKGDMKKRIKGKSPDAADAYFIGLATIIKRLRLRPGVPPMSAAEREERRAKALTRGIVVGPQLRGAAARHTHTMMSMFGVPHIATRGRAAPAPTETRKHFL